MTFETWLVFFLSYLLVTISPGPNVLLVVTHSVKFGYRSIFVTIAANLLCQLAIVSAVALGVGALMTVDSALFMLIKYCGAAYLIFLVLKMIRASISANIPASQSDDDNVLETVPSKLKRFGEAFFVSAGNPKTVVFLAAFLPQFVDDSLSLSVQFAQMYLSICVIVISIHAIYALIAIFLKGNIVDHRIRRGTTAATGGLFVFLGVGLSRS